MALLFSSHGLDLVERLCGDLVILSGGRVVAAGSADNLRDTGTERVRVMFENADAAWLRDVRSIQVLDIDGPSALVELAETSVPVWQLAVAVVNNLVAIVLLVRLAARVYERTLMRTERKISYKEALTLTE